MNTSESKQNVMVVGGGCFWCLESVFLHVKGVTAVVSGYAGGTVAYPSYERVCSGTIGHAEVVRLTFDPEVISFEVLLNMFFSVHDPTSLNRQGNDVGTQYRSLIVAQNEEQQAIVQKVIEELSTKYADPVVTEVICGAEFYPAEEYHQRYFEKNPDQAYCRLVIAPKLARFRREHVERYY